MRGALLNVITRVAEKAKAVGVTINLEIVNRFESSLLNTAAEGMDFLRDTVMDNVYLHLDTFHMNIEEADPAQAIALAGDRLGYFHVGEATVAISAPALSISPRSSTPSLHRTTTTTSPSSGTATVNPLEQTGHGCDGTDGRLVHCCAG